MKETEKNLPLEKIFFDVEINGRTQRIPGIDETWLVLKERNFNKYISHPIPVNGTFMFGEREIWLELTNYLIDDLEWLLQQKHHIFWSFMIFSKSAHQLLISFLQEAPPFYMRNEFPKDEEMEKALEKIEHLVLLVFIRLSTEKESESRYVENLGQLLYENYLFTIPIILDICLIYGVKNRTIVSKMVRDVISAAPEYLNDLQEILPHLLHVLSIVRDKFDSNEMSLFNTKTICHFNEMRDLILHLYDSTSTVQLFFDIYSDDFNLELTESFESEIASFYSYVIPKIYKFIKSNDCNMFRMWNFNEKICDIRLDLLSIVRSRFCQIINVILNSNERKDEYANKYLTKMMEILHEPFFLTDYHRIYTIDGDLRILTDLCPHMDSENFSYVSKAIAPFIEMEQIKNKKSINDVTFESFVKQVKDIFPDLDNEFIESCLKYFDYNPERVISAVLENNIPYDLYQIKEILPESSSSNISKKLKNIDRIKSENLEMFNLMNDKTELLEMRERFSQLAFIPVNDYNDEYDDTYDSQDISNKVRDDVESERRPFVIPRILRTRESDEEEEEEDDDDDEEEEEKEEKGRSLDQFVANPAEIRAKQEQRRMEREKRDCVGRGRGRGQEKQVLANRDFKNIHKSFTANHNRRKLASRKRNMPLIHS